MAQAGFGGPPKRKGEMGKAEAVPETPQLWGGGEYKTRFYIGGYARYT